MKGEDINARLVSHAKESGLRPGGRRETIRFLNSIAQ